LLVPDLVAYNPVIVIPPFPIRALDVSTGSAPTPQVSQNAAVAASNLASSIDAGVLDESAAVDVTPGAAVWNDPTGGEFQQRAADTFRRRIERWKIVVDDCDAERVGQ
jgi:hypothetical protein